MSSKSLTRKPFFKVFSNDLICSTFFSPGIRVSQGVEGSVFIEIENVFALVGFKQAVQSFFTHSI